MAPAAEFKRLRAPQANGQTLVDPPASALPHLIAENRRQVARLDYDVQDRSLRELAASARGSLLRAAVAYTSRYRDVPTLAKSAAHRAGAPFILSGHQPQLFHPGVWYKNFVLGRLARQVGGLGIHVLIDSDLCRSATIRVPTGSAEQPRLESIAFDSPYAEVPFEERAVRDEQAFASFADRVERAILPLVAQPIVGQLWPLTLARRGHEQNLGVRMAQGRHALEAAWQNDTLELPQSAICQMPEFAWFVAHLLAQLPRFWSAHNDALAEYRRAHHLRNRAHPVPDLAEADGWLEAPFWVWTHDDPRRRPLFVRPSGDELEITDRHEHRIRLPLVVDGDAARAVDRLLDLGRRGVKIRTRALSTTLFARLLLSDLFLHGIGGAKYDQVTDRLARQFFGFPLPEFAAVSATLRLPLMREDAGRNLERRMEHQLRELSYHPEQFVNSDITATNGQISGAGDIVAAKRRWIDTAPTPANAYRRHIGIRTANAALQPYVAPLRAQFETELRGLQQRQRAAAILGSREYSFCLFPREQLEPLLLDEAAPGP
jgi:hypothetical protein